MKKCAKCGGSMYKTGGSTMKTKLDIASKPKIYGIPQTGSTGNVTAKKGGSVVKLTKKQDGGSNKSQPNPNSPTKQASYSKYDAVRNSASAMRKKTAPGPVVTPPTNTPVKRRGGMIKKKC